ncbi:MAG: hypothetical protein O6952_06410 [Planctomycetota bacterium]|nr:hypothetical protein [Planctomycetota bacterium]
MTRTLPKLGTRWPERLKIVRSRLDGDLSSPVRWRLRIKERILTFLISRYGAFPACDRPVVGGDPMTTDPAPPPPYPPAGRQPLSSDRIKMLIEKIADANREISTLDVTERFDDTVRRSF